MLTVDIIYPLDVTPNSMSDVKVEAVVGAVSKNHPVELYTPLDGQTWENQKFLVHPTNACLAL